MASLNTYPHHHPHHLVDTVEPLAIPSFPLPQLLLPSLQSTLIHNINHLSFVVNPPLNHTQHMAECIRNDCHTLVSHNQTQTHSLVIPTTNTPSACVGVCFDLTMCNKSQSGATMTMHTNTVMVCLLHGLAKHTFTSTQWCAVLVCESHCNNTAPTSTVFPSLCTSCGHSPYPTTINHSTFMICLDMLGCVS